MVATLEYMSRLVQSLSPLTTTLIIHPQLIPPPSVLLPYPTLSASDLRSLQAPPSFCPNRFIRTSPYRRSWTLTVTVARPHSITLDT